jgi:hypothetical protein
MKTGRSTEPTEHFQYWAQPERDLLFRSDGSPFGDRRARHANTEPLAAWCVERFGPDERNKRWTQNHDMFWFRDESDLTMFLIRWS